MCIGSDATDMQAHLLAAVVCLMMTAGPNSTKHSAVFNVPCALTFSTHGRVMNHSGYGEYNEIAVFNDSKHYHDCTGCITSEYGLCSYNVSVLWQSEHCRLVLDLSSGQIRASDGVAHALVSRHRATD